MAPWLAAVVPTLNEAERVEATLSRLIADAAVGLVVVADGGSEDGTSARAAAFANRHTAADGSGNVIVIDAPRGRASQLNAGARRALLESGVTALLFVHADCGLPSGFGDQIAAALVDQATIGGAFRTWTIDDTGRSALAPLLHLADLRSRYSSLPYGDQAPFMRTSAFLTVGGYPDQPLMEDLEMSRRLRRLGRIRTLRSRVTVSGRRFVARPVFYTVLVNVFPLLYRLGVSAERLARLYRHVR